MLCLYYASFPNQLPISLEFPSEKDQFVCEISGSACLSHRSRRNTLFGSCRNRPPPPATGPSVPNDKVVITTPVTICFGTS